MYQPDYGTDADDLRVFHRAGALLAPYPDGNIDTQKESLQRWHALLAKHPECGLRVGFTRSDHNGLKC